MKIFFFVMKNWFKKLLLIFMMLLLRNYPILLLDKEDNYYGVFTINSRLNNNLYFYLDNENLKLGNKHAHFDIIKNSLNNFYFRARNDKKLIGIDKIKNEKIILYEQNDIKNSQYFNWNFKYIGNDEYIIQNNFNKKYLKLLNTSLVFDEIDYNSSMNQSLDKAYIFRVLKLFDTFKTLTKRDLIYIEKEPIDVCIKYIDLTDKSLNREGIKQIYKDQDNEELRYSLRSILQYIPWVRKIFILMPNEKVKFLKPYEEIKEKFVYVKDKELIGFDSSNSVSFQFNLYKMEKFGISKNFIYMDDDYFIGRPLKKSDLFYYDKKQKKIFPYILTSFFSELDNKKSLELYNKMIKKVKEFKPQGADEYLLSFLNTEKYLIEKYNKTIITTHVTHNALPENIDDLKNMFISIQNYKYINETLFSKTRHPLRLNSHYYNNLFQLNINNRKVNSIHFEFFEMENINVNKLNAPLFCINTCGNNIPTKKQYENEKKIMQKRFPIPMKYEMIDSYKF